MRGCGHPLQGAYRGPHPITFGYILILIAVSPEVRERLAAVLRGHEVTWADEVRDAMHGRYDLIVLGSHFAESTALELLEEIKRANPEARLVCMRGLPFPGLGSATMDAFRTASEALGAARVVDLLAYEDNAAGNARLRAVFEELLTWRAA